MKSRKRVEMALLHKQPDRIPLDLGGGGQTGMHASRRKLKGSECAGINRIGIEIESILRRKFSRLLRPSAEGRMR